MKNAVRTYTYGPLLTDKKTSLQKHKMGARDSMLRYLISTRFKLWYGLKRVVFSILIKDYEAVNFVGLVFSQFNFYVFYLVRLFISVFK